MFQSLKIILHGWDPLVGYVHTLDSSLQATSAGPSTMGSYYKIDFFGGGGGLQ